MEGASVELPSNSLKFNCYKYLTILPIHQSRKPEGRIGDIVKPPSFFGATRQDRAAKVRISPEAIRVVDDAGRDVDLTEVDGLLALGADVLP